MSISITKLESLLLSDPRVYDYFVQVDYGVNNKPFIVAYIVPIGKFLPEKSFIESSLSEDELPDAVIPLTSIPRTSMGLVDEEALKKFNVIDKGLTNAWTEAIRNIEGVTDVEIIAADVLPGKPNIHLFDLLPEESVHQSTHDASKIGETRDDLQRQTAKESSDILALSQGQSLELDEGVPMTLGDMLRRTAKINPESGIYHIASSGEEKFQPYPNLLHEAQCILAGLRSLERKAGDKAIFLLDSSEDFIPCFWAATLGGMIPVPISIPTSFDLSNNTIQKFLNAWKLFDQPIVLTNEKMVANIQEVVRNANLSGFEIKTVQELRPFNPDKISHISQPEDLAILLLTSGSTGKPKAVMQTHENLINRCAGTTIQNHFTPDDISFNWMPLDHVGGIVMFHLRDVYVGCKQIHALTEYILGNPLRWLRVVDAHRVSATWAPNFAFGLVNDRAEAIEKQEWDLSCLRFILNGGEAIVTKTARQFMTLLEKHKLPATAMYPAWGMSETCSGVTYSSHFQLDTTDDTDQYVDVGEPIPGISLRIVDPKGKILNEDEIGHLQIKGCSVTKGYYRNEELNRQVFSQDGWFKTGDLGFLHQGSLTITGREKDEIIINGVNYVASEIEAAVESMNGVEVSYTAACSARLPGSQTDGLAIFFCPTSWSDTSLKYLLERIDNVITKSVGITPSLVIPMKKSDIPKTAIGKIQRTKLKDNLEKFAPQIRKVDILRENTNTIPDWFYKKIWQRWELTDELKEKSAHHTIIFMDRLGLGGLLCEELKKADQKFIKVEDGTEFSQVAQDHFRVDCKSKEHYNRLFTSMHEHEIRIEEIVHLGLFEEYSGEVESDNLEKEFLRGFYPVIHLVQALHRYQGNKFPVQMLLVSSNIHAVKASDKIAFEKSPLTGILKTFPQELSWLNVRHVDLETQDLKENLRHVVRETRMHSSFHEIAYRDGQRFVWRLKQVDFKDSEEKVSPFKIKGVYLLSGGLGGIGCEIARHLLNDYQARLFLVGRSPLPPKEDWEGHLTKNNALAKKIKAYKELKDLDGEVIYQALDITNPVEVKNVRKEISHYYGKELDGILHLAGVYKEKQLLEETIDGMFDTLKPKTVGTMLLFDLIKDNPKASFVCFSSVLGLFSGANIGAYAAANSFLSYFTAHRNSVGPIRNFCVDWSAWQNTGLNNRFHMDGLSDARGYVSMKVEEAVNSLLCTLRYNQFSTVIGLDRKHSFISRHIDGESAPLRKLYGFYVANEAEVKVDSEVKDCLGNESHCELIRFSRFPKDEEGKTDHSVLLKVIDPNLSRNQYVAPRNKLELQLTKIWEKTLGINQVGVTDDYWQDLGGHSVQAMQLIAELEKTFDRTLPLVTFFQAPTIEKLVRILNNDGWRAPWGNIVELQSNGNKPPIFGVHGITGHIFAFKHVLQYLDPDQPIYGIQPMGLDGLQKPLTQLDEMAAHYIHAVREVQPSGPYIIIGTSFGGFVAFEMAQQLYRMGEKIALLGMVDTPISEISDIRMPKIPHIGRESRISVQEANRIALNSYKVEIYPGCLTLFLAGYEGARNATIGRDLGWTEYVSGDVDILEIPGKHPGSGKLSMFKEPYVKTFASQLQECINKSLTANV